MKLYAFLVGTVPYAAMWDPENKLIHFAGEEGTFGCMSPNNGDILSKRPAAYIIQREVTDHVNFINGEWAGEEDVLEPFS